ncbi:MAG: hypothetical protein ACI4UV_16630 [Victivallales bacterium]
MRDGVELQIEFPDEDGILDTAFVSLRRVLSAKKIIESTGSYPIRFLVDSSLTREEYIVKVTPGYSIIAASDAEGMRRGIYFFEDRICEAEGAAATAGVWNRRPYIRHRISRCFFGPTYRPPFFIDELTNDIDYYPEEYLDKLAHEGINGLWLTMYFRDLPSLIFEGRGANSEKRFAKLRRTVQSCARYGIRIYVFFSEPKRFGNNPFTIPLMDAEPHPDICGKSEDHQFFFCTSSEKGKAYLSESLSALFTAVPDLGGVINIMFGEDNGACVSHIISETASCHCPRCLQRRPEDIYREMAQIMTDAIHKISPGAEFIGWFYAPRQRDGSALSERLENAVSKWPAESGLMFNFESGGVVEQLGKGRHVFDYSLAYIGPSELFRRIAVSHSKMAAKLQVGCSHEDASVPFIPVPGNLYRKYRILHELGVYAVMQCWYFGNYPGIMNKAAGELSFEPFPENEDRFLLELARPYWRKHAADVVTAWKYLAEGYRQFPGNIAFEWNGPLPQSIAWPLYLFPVDGPISQSWILKAFPEVSGDRIGECLIYQHTLEEGLTLCRSMYELWQKGTDILESLRGCFQDDPSRIADINLACAISLQMRSTVNVLTFYSLREEMFYERKDNLDALKNIVLEEIENSKKMKELCEGDSRIGYHSEAEGYLFFPEKLAGRMKLLERLLNEDFPRFKLDAPFIAEYTGEKPRGVRTVCRWKKPSEKMEAVGKTGMFWGSYYDEHDLILVIAGAENKELTIEIEPCRLWPPLRIDVDRAGRVIPDTFIFREIPKISCQWNEGCLTIRIPFSIFDGYRREKFPMRINLSRGTDGWVKRESWEPRGLHRDFNPKSLGWLLFEPNKRSKL